MKEETKEITFEGKAYTVPTWVRWVSRDENGEVWGSDNIFYASRSYWINTSGKLSKISEADTSWKDSLTEV
jgi:hypothetical protein